MVDNQGLDCSTCAVIGQIDDYLLKTDHWYVILANDQAYLGRSFVTLRRHAESLSELTAEEWTDFEQLVRRLEETYVRTFGSGRPFNWSCWMNDAYKASPAQPHVHWHIRPRHDRTHEINDVSFTDPDYAHRYDGTRRQLVDEATWHAIADKLRSGLQSF